MKARTYARPLAALGAAALLVGPMAGGAQAAPKRKPPAPVITARPASPTNVRTATFAFTNTQAGVTFECSLDGAAYVACTSPKAYESPLGEATHTFRVRARDTAGTLSNPATATWTIDLTAPAAPALSGAPASPTGATTATLSFTTAETGASFLCSLDGAAATACTSPQALSGLGDGPHTFAVSVRDAAGNVGAPANAAWTVDTTPPPAPEITTGPATLTNATTAAFAVHNPDAAAALMCSLDAAAYAACPDPLAYAALSEAAHTLSVVAEDALGNRSAADQWAWTVDLTAPTPPEILTGPAALTKDPVGAFTINGFDAAELRCSLDGGDYATCPASYTTPSLADGPHTLLVKGVDLATNESGVKTYHWTVDNTPPPAPVVSGPPALTKSTTATFTFTNTEQVVSYTCRLDGGEPAPCESGVTFSSLGNGAHTLVVAAADALGNASEASHSWTVDTIAPNAAATFPAAITDPVVVGFTEPVTGVSATSLALRVSGTTTALRATLSCADAAAAAVSCATGPVKVATLRPAAALVPGERYSVVANPAASSTIADVAGNALPAKSLGFRAQTQLQEPTPAARYTWRNVASAAAYGGSYRTEHLAGAAASYTFTGTSVTWYTVRGRTQGVADVYVDGVKKATVNNYAASASYKVPRTVSGLTNARHVLRIVVRGVRGSTAGTGTFVAIDAVKVGSTLTATPSLVQTWRSARLAPASGGTLAVADLAGQDVTLRFRGTSVAWYTSTGPNRGIARVYVDGVLKATVDNYAAATAYHVRRAIGGLTDAPHTLRIVVTGTRRAAAKGSLVTIDRFAIG